MANNDVDCALTVRSLQAMPRVTRALSLLWQDSSAEHDARPVAVDLATLLQAGATSAELAVLAEGGYIKEQRVEKSCPGQGKLPGVRSWESFLGSDPVSGFQSRAATLEVQQIHQKTANRI